MKFIRYSDSAGRIHYGAEQPAGPALRIDGDIFQKHRDEVTIEIEGIGRLTNSVALDPASA